MSSLSRAAVTKWLKTRDSFSHSSNCQKSEIKPVELVPSGDAEGEFVPSLSPTGCQLT